MTNILILGNQGIGDLCRFLPVYIKLSEKNQLFFYIKNDFQLQILKYFNLNNFLYADNNHLNLIIFILKNKIDCVVIPSGFKRIKKLLLIILFNFLRKKIISIDNNINNVESLVQKIQNNLITSENKYVINHHPIILNDNSLNEYLMLAIGSGTLEKHKRLEPHFIINFLNSIDRKNNIKIGIIYGPEEVDLCNKWSKLMSEYNIIHTTFYINNFSDALRIINKAKIIISGCNGYAHIANLLGKKMIIFYGPTNHNLVSPISNNLIKMVSVNECSPCYSVNNITGCDNPTCMSKFSEIKLQNIKKTIYDEFS